MPSMKIMYTNTVIMTYITNTQKGEAQMIEITNLLFFFKKKKKKYGTSPQNTAYLRAWKTF